MTKPRDWTLAKLKAEQSQRLRRDISAGRSACGFERWTSDVKHMYAQPTAAGNTATICRFCWSQGLQASGGYFESIGFEPPTTPPPVGGEEIPVGQRLRCPMRWTARTCGAAVGEPQEAVKNAEPRLVMRPIRRRITALKPGSKSTLSAKAMATDLPEGRRRFLQCTSRCGP